MTGYKKILLALELTPESDASLLKKAQSIACTDAEVYLVHAVEHLSNYGAAYGVSAGVDVEEMLVAEAQKSMTDVAAKLNAPEYVGGNWWLRRRVQPRIVFRPRCKHETVAKWCSDF